MKGNHSRENELETLRDFEGKEREERRRKERGKRHRPTSREDLADLSCASRNAYHYNPCV